MTLLAIESSCDETSVAVVRRGRILCNLVASQVDLHAEYGGVVPELATRAHLKNLPLLVREALNQAAVEAGELEAIAATRGPGLPSALMVGYRAGEAMAFTLGVPFIGVHHHLAHLYSPWIEGKPLQSVLGQFEANVSLVVSGGHTLLVHMADVDHYRVLGSTIDDAAGECFDKVAKLIGLPYPGGPELDRLAAEGHPQAYAFPRPLLHDAGFDFSFSGLKTSIRYWLRDHPEILEDGHKLRDLCASAQAAMVEVLVAKTARAAKAFGVRCLTASGGVSRNRGLRQALLHVARGSGWHLRLAHETICTDNAGMVGILAEHQLLRGMSRTGWDEEVLPGWSIEQPGFDFSDDLHR